MEDFKNIAQAAKSASLDLMFETTERKNEALLKIAEKIEENKDKIYTANAKPCGIRRNYKINLRKIKT